MNGTDRMELIRFLYYPLLLQKENDLSLDGEVLNKVSPSILYPRYGLRLVEPVLEKSLRKELVYVLCSLTHAATAVTSFSLSAGAGHACSAPAFF